jgi:hypothetical protein
MRVLRRVVGVRRKVVRRRGSEDEHTEDFSCIIEDLTCMEFRR